MVGPKKGEGVLGRESALAASFCHLDRGREVEGSSTEFEGGNEQQDAFQRTETVEGVDKITRSAVCTLLGAWLVQLIIGAQLAMGNITVYFVSFFRMSLNNKDVDSGTFYPMQPIIVIIATFVYPFGDRLVDWFNKESRPVIALGASVALATVLACSFSRELGMGPMMFMAFYCLGMGIFKGMLQSALLRAGWSHLPERKGLVSGCVISGFGFGGFFFGELAQVLANPGGKYRYERDPADDKMYLPAEVGDRVPYLLRIFCLSWSLQVMMSMFLMSNYKKKEDQPVKSTHAALNNSQEASDEEQPQEDDDAQSKLPLLHILRSKQFLTIYFMAVCHLFYGYYYSNVYKVYGKDYINDDQFLTLVGATAGLCNGFFKILWASLLDYYDFRTIYGGLICLEISLIFIVQYAVHNRYAFFVVTCLTFMCDGSLTSMLPALTVAQFGISRGPQVYGYMFSVFGVAALSSTLVFKYGIATFEYRGMFAICSFFSLAAAALAYSLEEKKKFNYEEEYKKHLEQNGRKAEKEKLIERNSTD